MRIFFGVGTSYLVEETLDDCDHTLLTQAKSFDQTALTAIYDNYHPPIYRYVFRQVSEVEVARDLTAAVFQRFLQAIQNGNGPDHQLKAWLYRTAHNIVIDHYRRQQYRQHLPLPENLLIADDNPEQMADHALSAEKVRAALQRLTPEQELVISLKFFEGLTNAEVAEILDKPIGAVKSLQHRALAALQRQLKPGEEILSL